MWHGNSLARRNLDEERKTGLRFRSGEMICLVDCVTIDGSLSRLFPYDDCFLPTAFDIELYFLPHTATCFTWTVSLARSAQAIWHELASRILTKFPLFNDPASMASESFAPVVAALSTMQSNVERDQKSQAHEYLERFQKSVGHLRF